MPERTSQEKTDSQTWNQKKDLFRVLDLYYLPIYNLNLYILADIIFSTAVRTPWPRAPPHLYGNATHQGIYIYISTKKKKTNTEGLFSSLGELRWAVLGCFGGVFFLRVVFKLMAVGYMCGARGSLPKSSRVCRVN